MAQKNSAPDTARKCARWCGRGCTWGEYRAALAKAQRMVKLLGGTRVWRARAHENLGWHSSAVSRDRRLYVTESHGHWYCFVGDGKSLGAGIVVGNGRTPHGAVAHARRLALARQEQSMAMYASTDRAAFALPARRPRTTHRKKR